MITTLMQMQLSRTISPEPFIRWLSARHTLRGGQMALTKCRACSNGSSGTPADFCLPLPTQIDFHRVQKKLRQVLSMDICINEAYSGVRGTGAVTLHQLRCPLSPTEHSTGIAGFQCLGPGSPGNSGVLATNPGCSAQPWSIPFWIRKSGFWNKPFFSRVLSQ